MRIALVSRESYSLTMNGEVGGIGRYTEMTARGLASQGAEVLVLAQNTGPELAEKTVDGVRVVYLPKWEDTREWSWRVRKMETALLGTWPGSVLWGAVSDKNRRARVVSRYLSGLDDAGRSVDVVEFPECAAEGFFYSRKRSRTMCVTRVHGPTQMLCELNGVPKTPSLRLLMWAERRAAAASDHVTAPSLFAAGKALKNWGMGSKTPHVVPNMLDTDIFSPPDRKDARRSRPVIFFSGRLERRKGLMAFPELLSRLVQDGVDFQCRLCGRDTRTAPGGGSMKEWLIENCSPDARERLEFLGQVGKDALVREMRQADVGLFLSSYETFGYTCLEAQACGLPVVSTRLGGTGEVTLDGQTGFLVDPDDCRSVAGALRRLLEDAELRASMGREARRRAVEEYSLEPLSRRMLDLYRGLREEFGGAAGTGAGGSFPGA